MSRRRNVVHAACDFAALLHEPGSRQRYELIDEHGELVAMIDDTEQAIPLLEAHARANPPKWEREGRGYKKQTWFGVLLVEPATSGGWLAYRDLFPLLRNYGLAIFGSPTEAQAAGDAHLHDGYPTAVTLNDNLLWSAQSVRPLEVGVTNLDLAAITITGTLDGVSSTRLRFLTSYPTPSEAVSVGSLK